MPQKKRGIHSTCGYPGVPDIDAAKEASSSDASGFAWANGSSVRSSTATAQLSRGCRRRLHHRAHADDRDVGVVHAPGIEKSVAAAGEERELRERVLESSRDAVGEDALRHAALHVALLVLHRAGEDRLRRIEQAREPRRRRADEAFHELGLGEAHALDRVRRDESVLHVEERRLRVLRRPACDQREVGRLLRVARKEHPPPAVAHGHHVVVTAVDVQRLRGQCARADVEDDRQALAGDHVQDLFHEHEALAAGEVRDPAPGDREPLAHRRRGVLALRLEEQQRIAPEVLHPVHDRRVVAAAHGGRAGDRVSPGGLADLDLDVHDGFSAVARGRDAGVLEGGVRGLFLRLRRLGGTFGNGDSH
jgi:hypothetical protein